MDVLRFPPRLSSVPIACGMQTQGGVAVHVWRSEAKVGDLCLCGRRILPEKAKLPEREPCAKAEH